jgi:hypothetical protein
MPPSAGLPMTAFLSHCASGTEPDLTGSGGQTMALGDILPGFNLLMAIVALQSRAAPVPAPAITVVVRDYAGVAAPVLQGAEGVATSIFQQIGIDIRWLHSRDLPIAQGPDMAGPGDSCRRRFFVDLIPSALEKQTDPSSQALGSSTPSESYSRVFVGRVDALVPKGDAHERGQLLGHVMAHELGHLLLGRTTHALAGLMATDLDVKLARQRALTFSPQEGATIRRNAMCGSTPIEIQRVRSRRTRTSCGGRPARRRRCPSR